MTSTRQVRNYFCHTMQQVENRIGDHTFHELFDTWFNEELAKAWEEGFDAGEKDVFLHEVNGYDSKCVGNPYRNPDK